MENVYMALDATSGARRRIRTVRQALLPALFAVLLIAPSAAGEDEGHELLKGFQLSGKYILLVDGEHARKARIYHSRLAAAYLVLDAPFDSPLVISPRTRKVQTVPEDSIVERDDGNVYLKADVEPCDVCPFRLERGHVRFRVGKHAACLKPKPILLGYQELEDLLAHSPEYERDGALYEPDEDVIEALKDGEDEVDVLVLFGSWCPTCRRYVPLLLRVAEALEGSRIKFRYYGIPRAPAVWRDPVFRKTGLRHVPAVEVRVDGKVLGRFCGHECTHPEKVLQRLLD